MRSGQCESSCHPFTHTCERCLRVRAMCVGTLQLHASEGDCLSMPGSLRCWTFSAGCKGNWKILEGQVINQNYYLPLFSLSSRHRSAARGEWSVRLRVSRLREAPRPSWVRIRRQTGVEAWWGSVDQWFRVLKIDRRTVEVVFQIYLLIHSKYLNSALVLIFLNILFNKTPFCL